MSKIFTLSISCCGGNNTNNVNIYLSHAEIRQTVHDVVNALSKVIVQILVTGGGDSKKRGAAGGRLVRLVSMAGGKGNISQVWVPLY